MASDRVLSTQLYPYVEKAFSQKKNIDEYEKIIGLYIDRNADALSEIGPIKMIYFTDHDSDPIFRLIGISPSEVKKIKNSSADIKSKGRVMDNPFNSLMAMIIRYFAIHKNQKMLDLSIMFLALSMYPSIFYKYFKYEPNVNIMNYTINNLSEKFMLKKTSNILLTITNSAQGAYKLHEKKLIEGSDAAAVQFVLAIKTRFNSFMRKLSREFYKNHQEGNYLNTEVDNSSEDNYSEADSSTYAVNRIVDNIALKLVIDGPPIKLINMAAKTNSVSVSELRNYITTMITDERIDDIKSIIESIIFIFLFDKKNTKEDINSDRFLIYCLDMYRRSNVNEKNLANIKNILNSWLEELGTYKKTNRVATINNFRRALYTFFVMAIMYYNK